MIANMPIGTPTPIPAFAPNVNPPGDLIGLEVGAVVFR
jgi:hypothetical protein